MKKTILIICSLPLLICADFSKEESQELAHKASEIRKELKLDKPPLTEKEKKIIAIRKELNMSSYNSLKDPKKVTLDTTLSTTSNTMKRTILADESSGIADTLSSTFTTIKKSLTSEEKEDSFSLYKSFGLDEGEYWGLPSVFGLNKKEEESTFGLNTFTDIKEMSGNFYKGFKHSGESAEFMSGVMYYNAKMYNTMFGMFDDSPLNIFEDEEETSIFDVFEKGNDVLDIFN
jgi:hypothetical protein